MKKVFLFIFALFIVCKGLQAQQRVTGGFPIDISDAPWQVLVSVDGALCCGGSIIAPNFILTAKHCVEGWFSTSRVQVFAGVTCKDDFDSNNDFEVCRVILHPDPNVDAALIQLCENISYTNNIQPINYLASVDNTLYDVGNEVHVSGWGWTIPNNDVTPNCLEAANLNIISNQDASNALTTWDRDLYAHEMAATGTGNIRQGACHCDSGGPLTILSDLDEPLLIGIVKGGRYGCDGNNQNSPSVFVRVSHIRDWITTNICPIPTINFTTKIVTANTTVIGCRDINVLSVTVTNGASLVFEARGNINIEDVTVENNSKLILNAEGKVNIISDFNVELGSKLELK